MAWMRARSVLVMPGTLFHRPWHFRISLTATRESVEQALPVFEQAATAFSR